MGKEAYHREEPGVRAVLGFLGVPWDRDHRVVLDVQKVLEVPWGRHVLVDQLGHREDLGDRVVLEVREVLAVLWGHRGRMVLPFPLDHQGQGDRVAVVVGEVVVVEEVEVVVVVEARNIPLYMTGRMIPDNQEDMGSDFF